MSVTYEKCEVCGECRYDEFVHHCEECGEYICNWCLEEENPGIKISDMILESGELDSKYCPICRGEDIISDSDLLEFLLEKLNITRDDVEKEYFGGENATIEKKDS